MSLINIVNLTFGYEGSYDNIFENVSFQIDTRWKLGFTGRNGRGKTTFLNLLRGKYEYSGTISVSVEFDYFPFSVTDTGKNTIDIITDIVPESEEWMIHRELALLQVSEAAVCRSFELLSKGEQTKVLLAALFLQENHFLLIDEPTNHLDLEAREIVSAYLNSKSGYILVSHDRVFLDNCIDHILSINKTDIEIQKGNFSSWWHNKQLQDAFEIAENEKLAKDIGKLTRAARQTADWSFRVEKTKYGTKGDRGYIGRRAAKMMKRSKATEARRQRSLDKKEKLLQNIETADSLSLKTSRFHKKQLVEAKNLTVLYDHQAVCRELSFTLNQGDRIALIGNNGSGKTSILKLLVGEAISYTGMLNIGSGLTVSYVAQDTTGLYGDLKEYAQCHAVDESLFKAILRKLDFSRVQFDKDISDFSEGQKKKVLLARSLCEQAHLYIWDEPLNYIDLLSRMQIEELIIEHQPSLLFVEHDRSFIDKVATKMINLS